MNYNNRFIYKNRCGIYLINYYKMGKYHISYFVKANLPYYDKLININNKPLNLGTHKKFYSEIRFRIVNECDYDDSIFLASAKWEEYRESKSRFYCPYFDECLFNKFAFKRCAKFGRYKYICYEIPMHYLSDYLITEDIENKKINTILQIKFCKALRRFRCGKKYY